MHIHAKAGISLAALAALLLGIATPASLAAPPQNIIGDKIVPPIAAPSPSASETESSKSSSSSSSSGSAASPSPSPSASGPENKQIDTQPWTTRMLYNSNDEVSGALAESVSADGFPAIRITCSNRRDGKVWINPSQAELDVRMSTWVEMYVDGKMEERFRVTPEDKGYVLEGGNLRNFMREFKSADEVVRIVARDEGANFSLSRRHDALEFLKDKCGALR